MIDFNDWLVVRPTGNVSVENGCSLPGESSEQYVRSMAVLNGPPELLEDAAEVSSMPLAAPTFDSHYAVFDFDADEDSEEDQDNDPEQPDDVVSSSSVDDSSPYLYASFHEHDAESPYSIVRRRDES